MDYLNEINVLVISEREEDKVCLEHYGFKNVDYFKSDVLAGEYFKAHMSELEKYDVLVLGDTVSLMHDPLNDKRNKFLNLSNKRRVVVRLRYRDDDLNKFHMRINRYDNWQSYVVETDDYYRVCSEIYKATYRNGVIEEIDKRKEGEHSRLNVQYFTPLLKMPTKRSEVKVLICSYYDDLKTLKKITVGWGLDVTFVKSDNFSFDKVSKHLGDFDIIIGTYVFDHALLSSSIESSEQCRKTGRRLTLLNCFKRNFYLRDYDIEPLASLELGINNIEAYTSRGGLLYLDRPYAKERFPYCFEVPIVKRVDAEFSDNYREENVGLLKAYLEGSFLMYDEALKELGYEGLSDIDRDCFDRTKEHTKREVEDSVDAELKTIRQMQAIEEYAKKYLELRQNGRTFDTPNGLSLNENDKTLRVQTSYKGRVLTSITFLKESITEDANIFVFNLQVSNKKGRLEKPTLLGVAPYRLKQFIKAREPKEDELIAIESVYKKIITTLKPIVDKAIGGEKRFSMQPHE